MTSKKAVRFFARILIVIMMASIPVMVPDMSFAGSNTSPTATGKVDSAEGAFLRKSASKKSAKVTGLDDNTELVIMKEVFVTTKNTSSTKRWYRVKAGKKKGYIRADLVKDITYSSVSAVTNGKTNYRNGAGTSMKKRGTLKKGSKVTVLLKAKARGSSKEWYKIKKGNKQYYVAASNIEMAKNGVSDESATSDKVAFTLEDVTYPNKVGEGSPFVLKGTITCTEPMSKVEGGIADNNGSWVTSVSTDLNDKSFDISTIDTQIKFGTLEKGSYVYKVNAYVDNKCYTKINRSFTVVKQASSRKITDTAFKLCWPIGTSSSKYKYGTSNGSATGKYTAALESAYPDRSKWGAAPKVGASCDVFVGTVLRASGVDPDAPRGLDEQFPYYKSSDKYTRISYNGDHSVLRSGDIILFSMKKGGAHTCLYLVKDGKEYIAEANYKHTYAYIVRNTSDVNWRLKPKDKKEFFVYRANAR